MTTKTATESKQVIVDENVFPVRQRGILASSSSSTPSSSNRKNPSVQNGTMFELRRKKTEEGAKRFEQDIGNGPEDDGEEVLPPLSHARAIRALLICREYCSCAL